MIIGVTGSFGAGKSETAKYLQKKGFIHLSVRDLLLTEIKKRGLKQNRDNLVAVGNDLRKKHGGGYTVQTLAASTNQNKNYVIESIRVPDESTALKKYSNSYILAINTKLATRYERITKRGSYTDNVSFSVFVQHERREKKSKSKSSLSISDVIKKSDFKITNNGTKTQLHKKIDQIIKKIERNNKHIRPSWDDYFMEVADAISKRARSFQGSRFWWPITPLSATATINESVILRLGLLLQDGGGS